uniref:Ribonuclease H-like domain-containing protein n=1 Tax=Tanacetum cinerariifolium TaxID=118510 RepID=A0A6L2JV76_TANCI|nr:ribonuclease H-like domain-containing protein [Tanacetum cinerariifolium]
MEAYFQKIESLVTTLTSLDCVINDEDVVHYAITGLPKKYNQVSGYMHYQTTFPDLKMVHSLFVEEEMHLKTKEVALPMDSSSPMVLVRNKMLKAFPLPVISSHCQIIFPLLVKTEFGVSYEAPQKVADTESASEGSAKKKGRTVAVTTEDMQKMRNDVKARTTLLLALPDEHQLRFSKSDIDTMSLDDLYNYLKVYEPEVQKKSELNSQNMAFIFSAKNSSGKEEINTASFSTVKYKDINQIDEDDIEEMDIKWNMALLKNHALVADQEDPTEFALMAKSSFENKVFDNALCSKACKKNTDSLNTKITELSEKLSDTKTTLYHYKLGLSQVEARLVEFKNQEIRFCEKIRGLEFKVESKYNRIERLTKELEELKKEKKGLDSKLTGFQSASKDLDTLLGSQGPSPSIESNSSDLQNSDSSVSEKGDSSESIMSKPMIKFVKATDSPTEVKISKVETVRKPFVKHAEMYRNTTKSPKGNSHNVINDKGYWDNGCCRHMTGNISYLLDYEPYDGGYMSFRQGGGKITGKGIIKTGKLEFENVYFVKDLKYNLFSVSQIHDNKNSVLSTDSECIMLGRHFFNNVLLRTPRQHNMHSIDLNNIVMHKDLTCLVAKVSTDECMLWHMRLVKHHKASCKTKLVHSVSNPLHTLHMDLFGPTSDETSGILRNFITEIENLKELKVKVIRCDNGGEFRNKEMNDFCSKKGIKRELSNARTPQQNGVAERRNMTLIEAARTMLADAKLPVSFWAEAINTACYVQNRVLVNKSQNKTPYELFNGRSPAIRFLKPFGCHVMILNTLDNLGKFDAKGDECYFIRYSMSNKAFRIFNKRTLTNSMNYVPVVVAGTTSTNFSGTKDATSQDVKKDVSSLRYIALLNWFHEAHLKSSTSNDQDACKADAPKSSRNSNPTATSINPPADHMETLAVETVILIVSSPVLTACLDDSLEPSSDTRLISKRVTSQDDTPSLDNILNLSNRFEDILGVTTNTDDTNRVEADLGNMEYNISASPTSTFRIHKDHPKKPKKIFNALQDPSWVEAMQDKLLQFKIQNVWSLVDCPKGMDVKNAFLYGTIDEEVYVMQPPGFQDPKFPARVYKVEKAMNGVHQAPKAWHRGDFILVQVYVDDIIFGSSNPLLCREFEALMHDKFQMNDVGELNFFLGLQVQQKKDGIFLSQDKYVGHPKLGLWYPKESPFDLVAYSDSDYDGATQDQKSTTGGCQFLGRRLISWQCKKQTIMATSTTEAEYVAAASGCGQVLWIQNSCLIMEKYKHNIDFHQIVDFVKASHIRIETTDEGTKILATVEGKPRTISKSSIRRNLKLNDEAGISSLPDAELFENLALMGPKSTGFNEFSSNIATAVQGEACPTITGLEAGQDMANIIKTSTLPHDSSPVTSLAADEGTQDLEITILKARIKLLEDKDGGGAEPSGAIIKGRSLETEEEVEVATVSVPTGSGLVPTASLIFPTASVVTPYLRRKGIMARDAQRMNEQIARDAEIARMHAEEELQMLIDGLDRSNEHIAKHLHDYEQAAAELTIGEKIELINELVKYQDHHAKILKYQAQQSKPLSKKQQREFYMSVLRSHAGIKRKGLSLEQGSAKKMKTAEDVFEEELKQMIQLVPVEEIYVEALQVKYPIIDWEIHIEGQRNYWKIIKLGGSIAVYQFFVDMLKHFDKEDLNQLWTLVKETLSIRQATIDKKKELWVELKRLYEPDVEDQLGTHTQALMHDPVEWRLYDTCGVHHVLFRDQEIFISTRLQTIQNKEMIEGILSSDEFLLPNYFPTACEDRFLLLSKKDAPVEEVCTADEVKIQSSGTSVLMAQACTNHQPSNPQIKLWPPCFNFSKVSCRFRSECRYVHDPNAKLHDFGTSKVSNTSNTDALLVQLLEKLNLKNKDASTHGSTVTSTKDTPPISPLPVAYSTQHNSSPACYLPQPISNYSALPDPIVKPLMMSTGNLLSDGTLSRYKAWLVADGSTQLEGIDVDETFSAVVKPGTIRTVCLHMNDPREPHFSALKRILRYVFGTLDYGLLLFFSSTTDLVAYSDADWGGCPTTRRSTSGYCVFLGHNLLSWSAKRQLMLSCSSAKAEYQGVANAVVETCWLRNLLRELHTPLSSATLFYCDNVSAVYLSSNPVKH